MAPARAGLSGALRRWLPRPVLFVAALLAVTVALLPLAYLAVRTADAGTDRISQILFTERVARLALRSLGLATVVTAACLVLGIGSAFLVTRTDLPGRRIFGVLAALPLAIPTYVAGFAWVSQLPGFEGFWAAALVLILASYPYVYLPVAAALVAADPAQEEVAQSMGRGPWRTFAGVTLRQIRPAAAGGGLLVALYVLSDFGAVAVLRTDTLTRAVFVSLELGFDRIGAVVLAGLLVAMTIPILAGEAATRRRGVRYARLTGVRRPAARILLRRWRMPALLVLTAVAAAALGVTTVSLARRLAAGVSRPGAWSEVAAAAGASISLSLAGVALTMLLALPIGLLTARAPGPAATLVDRLGYLTHALPGVVVGLSLVFFGINVAYPLYQTTWLLALGYAALFLPLAVAASTGRRSPPRRCSTTWPVHWAVAR